MISLITFSFSEGNNSTRDWTNICNSGLRKKSLFIKNRNRKWKCVRRRQFLKRLGKKKCAPKDCLYLIDKAVFAFSLVFYV